jgi:hypothetical protein
MKTLITFIYGVQGNIGLLAVLSKYSFLQKIKTAKYVGNWDPKQNNLE